jgi:hypothetical protein
MNLKRKTKINISTISVVIYLPSRVLLIIGNTSFDPKSSTYTISVINRKLYVIQNNIEYINIHSVLAKWYQVISC